MSKLKEFFKNNKEDKWWYHKDFNTLPSRDFNKDIIHPNNYSDEYKEGALGLRVDGDFWAVAAMPYEFSELTTKEIVTILWPESVGKAYFKPDSVESEDDYKQMLYYKALKEKQRNNRKD